MDKRKARKLLKAERERLESLLGTTELDSVDDASMREALGELSPVDQHPADIGSETFEIEKDLSIRESIEAQIEDVDRALRKLDNGHFGVCETCGKPIPAARLEAKPAARYCVEDQASMERHVRAEATR
jgi:RNA polymerase-binding transcription factor DksA